MKLVELETQKLARDYSNLADIPIYDLKGYLAGSNQRQIRAKLEEMTLAAAQRGYGVAANTVPQPYEQRELECQTIALINGINSVGAASILQGRDIYALVESVRSRAVSEERIRSGKALDERDVKYATILTEQYFKYEGIPLEPRLYTQLNPITIAETLFQKGRFMIISDLARWHVTTLVPLVNPTKKDFVMELDSLGEGKKRFMYIEEYVNKILSHTVEDTYRVYQTTPR